MGRLPRVYIEGILYYVTSKSGHNEELFIGPSDYRDYMALMDSYKKQYGFKLFSYALMPTHLHMLIELKNNVHISNIMHDLNSLYTKNFNGRYGKKGHLFQERFKALLAEKDPYLLRLVRHIHLSPVRANTAEDPKDYPYSSHPQFLDPEKGQSPDIREEIEEVFDVLKGREQAFEKYVANGDSKEMEDFRKVIHKKRILGSDIFVEQIKKAMEESIKRQKAGARPRRKYMVYMALSGIAVLVIGISIASFYKRQHAALKSVYDKNLEVYDSTLEMLKREKEKAVKANEDIAEYVWKIKLVENALAKLQQEKKEAEKMQKNIEGYSWDIKLRQIGGAAMAFNVRDKIFFKDGRVSSANLAQEGFRDSTYSERELENGSVVWETIQTNRRGETASWRGEWNGKIMKGVLSRRSAAGRVRDYSFASLGERITAGR